MADSDTIITLVGSRLANEGMSFTFIGETPDCDKCNLKSTCMNLEKGRIYTITNVRNATVHDCVVHDGGVIAVDVIIAPVTCSMDSRKAVEGAKTQYESPVCDEIECGMYDMCHPKGVKKGDKYTIAQVIGNMDEECILGYSLKKVELAI
ncbi:MAG TPA: UPF0179 family protein [Methanosarcinaceae archaeon]|nr:UPF0179 family protein [Methanosarcinaceae archaeon]